MKGIPYSYGFSEPVQSFLIEQITEYPPYPEKKISVL
jgi:hypothetical protein